MEPIVPINDTKPIFARRGTPADLIAAILAGLAAISALGYSLYYFTRFLENDSQFWGTVSAFLLCFGVGALGFIPAAFISRIAWRAHKNGATRKGLLWAMVLLVPWLGLSLILVFISALPLLYSLLILAISALLTVWAGLSLHRYR